MTGKFFVISGRKWFVNPLEFEGIDYICQKLSIMVILDKPITRKGVVDVDQELLALDAELHSELEGLLLKEGSQQEALWGINLYPEADDEDFLEFDSLINIRPRQGNRSRDVENEEIRERIRTIVNKYMA